MRPKGGIRPKYDMLWKGMIEAVMGDMLRFVDPDIDEEVDLKRGVEFLDKELGELSPISAKPSKSRVVDKLIKVFLRNGGQRWMLLHIEVQGSSDAGFAKRMFQYYYRILDRHDCPIAAIAILTGKDGRRMPSVHEDECLWTRLKYEYKTLCIADYSDEFLETSDNPFAAALLVAKEVLLQVKGDHERNDTILLKEKRKMLQLWARKRVIFGERKAAAVLVFLKNYVAFKIPETNLSLWTT